MIGSVEFYWIRHGETQWNVDRRFQGQLNPPLNENGRAQARLLAARLVNEGPFDILVSSDLARASQTAQCISEALGIPVSAYYEELRERYVGRLQGLTVEEAKLSYGPDFRQQPLGLETPEEMRARAIRASELILGRFNRHARILVASHGGLIRAFMLATGFEVPEPLRNTSITRMVYGEDGWSLVSFNDTAHLGDMEQTA